MHRSSIGSPVRRRKEVVLLLAALAVTALAAAWCAARWLGEEHWGEPITARSRDVGAVPSGPVTTDFAGLWEGGGRNPFGDAAVALESGGKAKIPLPFAPPIAPEPPPAPMVLPLDLLTEGGR